MYISAAAQKISATGAELMFRLVVASMSIHCIDTASAVDKISIAITSPVDGARVAPGSTITVAAMARSRDHNHPISDVVVISPIVASSLPAPHYSATLQLPPTFSGIATFVAFARDRETFEQSAPLTVIVTPNDTMMSLTASPSDYSFGALGGTRALEVVGTYAGGETADISNHLLGTTYVSSANNIVAVSDDGMITAVGNGTAVVTVQNGAYRTTVPITVAGPTPNTPPLANAGPNQTVGSCDVVALAGNQSMDPNGQLLSFVWKQISGPAVRIDDSTSPTPSFIAPNREGVLRFSLRVTDFVGLSATAESTVIVKACRSGEDHRCEENWRKRRTECLRGRDDVY